LSILQSFGYVLYGKCIKLLTEIESELSAVDLVPGNVRFSIYDL